MKKRIVPSKRRDVQASQSERVPAWNGEPMTIQLSDYTAFVNANKLTSTRSWIVTDEHGIPIVINSRHQVIM